MADERKRRLEEIRRKKAQIQQMLKTQEASSSATAPSSKPSEPPKDPAIALSSKTTQEKGPSVEPRKTFFEDSSKNAKLMQIHIKRINESLQQSNFTEFLQGIYPELKNEETQFEEEEKKIEEVKQTVEKMKNTVRRASVRVPKEKLKLVIHKVQQQQKDVQKKREVPIEKINDFMAKNEENLKSFLDNSPFLEESLYINDIMDICTTYYDETETGVEFSKKKLVAYALDLYDEQCNGRIVNALDWSTFQQDLFLASFTATENFNQQSGLIQLWSVANKKAPFYTINYQTEITSSLFYNYNPNIVLAGSFTGQIIMWDIKSKPTPVQKSMLGIGDETTSTTHRFPISCMCVSGNENNSTLLSLSTDGVLCEWSLGNLTKPINKINIVPNKNAVANTKDFNELSPLCMVKNPLSRENILIGTDEGNIYNIKVGSKDYLIQYNLQTGKAPIFCIDPHPCCATDDPKKYRDLVLTCGADWTAKLWLPQNYNKPLLTFNQATEYVYSVKWHPTNPAIFVTADGSGNIDFWDLNRDFEMPTSRHELKNAANKLAWSTNGKNLAVGDDKGHVTVFAAEKEVFNVKREDFAKFDKVLENIKENYSYMLEKEEKKKKKEIS